MGISNRDLRPAVERTLVRMAAGLLATGVEAIDVTGELGHAGFDSLRFTRLANRIGEHYGIEIEPTIFFEHQTIATLAGHLVRAHTESIHAVHGMADQPTIAIGLATDEILDSQRDRAGEPRRASDEPVAIVGMSARFPGSPDLRSFWNVLTNAQECIGEIPADRWDWRAIDGNPRDDVNRTNIRWGGFIDGAGDFDPLFFGISPKEAELMDPQQRLLLMAAVAAVEDAGHSPRSLAGSRTGVFVGLVSNSGYSQRVARAGIPIEGYSATAWSSSMGPNRISYWLDLRGPSEPVETTCSSSLVAIQRAMRAIQTGDCEMALAGGVNLIVSPVTHVSFSKAGMLSDDGHGRAFSAGANGYVRGEGVAMLFLKALSAAERDGDEIYALLRGGAVNHGGRSSSLTSPNPVAQTVLLLDAYAAAGVDPRSIGFVEAHGTGTPLGDPIEMNSLKAAFEQLGAGDHDSEVGEARCGIGSVKGNIGHLEAAAGVAGVIKVVLQLQHRTLVKSLHSEPRNPLIRLDDSPFYIVTETQPWPGPVDHNGRLLPRRAGVSSFGIGGVNAHVIVEEYVDSARAATDAAPGLVGGEAIVLSAKDDVRLQMQVTQLLDALQASTLTDGDVARIAYTLQVGREAMAHRLAFGVRSLAELLDTLAAIASGAGVVQGVYRGIARRTGGVEPLAGGDSVDVATQSIGQGTPDQLLQLWATGVDVDWRRVYPRRRLKRIRLPTYPFARERYWIETAAGNPFTPAAADPTPRPSSVDRWHPFLHKNTSTFAGQRFSSVFTGDEPFLRDHVIRGRRVFPAVAYLEMAQAAAQLSLGYVLSSPVRVSVIDVVWPSPLYVDARVTVHIRVARHEDGNIDFEVYTGDSPAAEIVHSRGRVLVAMGAPSVGDSVEVERLRSQCDTALAPQAHYAALAAEGVAYGSFYRGLRSISVGSAGNGGHYVVADVAVPDPDDGAQTYLIHPAALDAALHASIGLRLAAERDSLARPLALPFALHKLDVLAPTPPIAVVYARPSGERTSPVGHDRGRLEKLDVTVSDPDGRVCVELSGLMLRRLEPDRNAPPMLLRPMWTERALRERPAPGASSATRHVWLTGDLADAVDTLELMAPHMTWRAIPASNGAVTETVVSAAEHVFAQVREHMRTTPSSHLIVQVVVPAADGITEGVMALSGLFKTAHRENPYVRGQVVALTGALPLARLVAVLAANARTASPADTLIRAGGTSREVVTWAPVVHAETDSPAQQPWRDGGVYLITGGTGRLAALLAGDIRRQAPGAHIVLAGRSAAAASTRPDVTRMQEGGGSLTYLPMDVCSVESVHTGIAAILATHGCLTGFVHCAGVIDDNFIIRKEVEEFRSVLSPKIAGLAALDEATRTLPLEIIVLFSSIGSVFGNVGQSDYATANAFLDWFAAYRNRLVREGRRHGRTIAINWPLWADGGMRVGAEMQAALRHASTEGLSAAAGLAALTRAWQTGADQIAVVPRTHPRLPELVVGADASSHATGTMTPASGDLLDMTAGASATGGTELHPVVARLLARRLASQLKLPPERLDCAMPLETYGVDSLAGLNVVNALEREFGRLSKTLLIDYPTLDELARYFLSAHRETILAMLPFEHESVATQP